MKVDIKLDSNNNTVKKIKIHKYDTFNCDYTLSLIILPLLKKFKKLNKATSIVDNKDIPKKIKSYNLHQRWDWVIDQMIIAFEYIVEDKLNTKLIDKKVKRGLYLFGKYYQYLWR